MILIDEVPVKEEWMCGAFYPHPPAYRCTRDANHKDDHVTQIDGKVVAVWKQQNHGYN